MKRLCRIDHYKVRLLLLSVLFLIGSTFLSGCQKTGAAGAGRREGQAVEEELIRFVNVDLPSIQQDRDEAVACLNGYFSEDGISDTGEDIEGLQKDTVEKYDGYLKKLAGLDVVNEEVVKLKGLYYDAAVLQRDIMEDMIEALETEDAGKIDEARNNLAKYDELIGIYKASLEELCGKYHIEIK